MTVVVAVVSVIGTAAAVAAGGIGTDSAIGIVSSIEAVAILVLTALAVRHAPARPAAVAAVPVVAVAIIPLRFRSDDHALVALIGVAAWGLVGLVVAGAGYHLRTLDEHRRRSVDEARELQRLQLARDLHDFVAHDVSEMLALAQAGRLVAGDDPRAAELFTKIEDAAQSALRSMDQTVHMLHTGGDARPAGLGALPALARRFADANGLGVHLHLGDGLVDADVEPTAATAMLYRVGVEALTNVRRHAAAATAVHIDVDRDARPDGTVWWAMTIADDAPATTPRRVQASAISRRQGLGLRTLAAGVAELGGELVAGPCGDAGWCVRVTLPVD